MIEEELKKGAPHNGMQEPDRTPYCAVLNPMLRRLLSEEPSGLTPHQVLSPAQRQALALSLQGKILQGGGGMKFGSTAVVYVCVCVFQNTG